MIHSRIEQAARAIINSTDIPPELHKALTMYSVGWFRIGAGLPPSFETDVLMLATLTGSIEVTERAESVWEGVTSGTEVQVFDDRGTPDYEGAFLQRATQDGQVLVEQKHIPGSRHRVLEDRVRLLGVSVVDENVTVPDEPTAEAVKVPVAEPEEVDEEAKHQAEAMAAESREAEKRFRSAEKGTKVEFFGEGGALVENAEFRGIEGDSVLVKVPGTRKLMEIQHRSVIISQELEPVG